MLILSRAVSQSIAIGDNITITVVNMTHGRVGIGIKAPKEIIIVRSELLERKDDISYRKWFVQETIVSRILRRFRKLT